MTPAFPVDPGHGERLSSGGEREAGRARRAGSMFDTPLLPASYLARLIALVRTRGVTAEQVLANTGIAAEVLDDAGARITIAATIEALRAASELVGDPGLGLELGLTLKPTSHSWYGYALMSAGTVRQACEIGIRYLGVRGMPWRVHLFTEGDTAVMQFEDMLDLGAARTIALECFLGAVIRMGEFLHGQSFAGPDVEFWADYPEQPHHARFRESLPRIRYACPRMQARHPAAWLDRPLVLSEPVGNREAVAALESELRLIASDDWVARTRALLAEPSNGYPDLDATARKLRVSSRTLRRHLQEQRTSFHQLRDDARRARAITLLSQSALTIDAVARELGYGDATGFARAFQRWTGRSPSHYRKRDDPA